MDRGIDPLIYAYTMGSKEAGDELAKEATTLQCIQRLVQNTSSGLLKMHDTLRYNFIVNRKATTPMC